MNRSLTETEKTIIGRDAKEQRSLSAELNGRASFIGALFGVVIGLVIQTNMLKAFPILQVFFIAGIAAAAFFMFWLSRGREYGYTRTAEAWITWGDFRDDELRKGGYNPAFAEREISDGYWRTLAKAASENRDANRYKSQVIKTAGPISLSLICLALLARLF